MNEPKHQQEWAVLNKLGLTPMFQVKRFDDGRGGRFYYWKDENGTTKIGTGITTILGKVMPESPELTNWKLKHGADYNKVLNLSAAYGTALHECIQEWLINRSIPNDLIERAVQSAVANGQNPKMVHKDLAAFMKFEEDYKLEPILIEAMLPFSAGNGFHGVTAMDLICNLKIQTKEKVVVQDGVYQRGEKKGQPKLTEVTQYTDHIVQAAIDFKSNFFEKEKKSFYETHMYQLLAGRKAIKENFGITINDLFNWSPNNWRSEPSYVLHRWNFSVEDTETLYLLFDLAGRKGVFTPSGHVTIVPETYNSETTWRDVYYKTYQELAEADNL